MESYILQYVPIAFINFLLTVLFSLLIGLEQRRHNIEREFETLFGTDRTFTLIGILGYILYALNTQTLVPFLGGGIVIGALLGVYYFNKINVQRRFGMTTIVTALITYCIGPLLCTQPKWLSLLTVVSVLIIVEIKENLFEFSKKFGRDEFTTLAKFLVIAGVILPLLPDAPISPEINISPYRFWLAIVAVSGISYFSYLLRKFVFPNAGILLTGILGGLYSSTATTVILAKKSKEQPENSKLLAAIFLATTMMYARIFLLALFFNQQIALGLLPYFMALIVLSALIALYFARPEKNSTANLAAMSIEQHSNPLEFRTAILFATLFIVFALLTGYVIKQYGGAGVNTLALIVGVTDIDPFILNLFQSKWNIADAVITIAVLNATTSNNMLKLIYGLSLSDKHIWKKLILGFSLLVAAGIIFSAILVIHG
ncbi:MAG TPA: MgtC/SapB family protein [Candidatus Kapabacteria bacterium]|nr:MgtC/SapB family protein [Candidatus Kapabacteria bacterium]